MKSAIAAQIEQESRWNPRAELHTSREWGVGYSQVTIAYNSKGQERFNNFKYIKSLNKDLKGWTWDNRFDAGYQIKALVIYNRHIYTGIKFTTKDDYEKAAFSFAAYNGGVGGVLQDRRLCANTEGCNPQVWFSNVEKTSLKNKTKVKGYGKSFFEINREYVRNVLIHRRMKYIKYLEGSQCSE